MERQEFNALLIQVREKENISKNQMCRLLGITYGTFQRIECSKNNYNINNVIKYLDVLAYDLSLSGCVCKNYQDIIAFIVKQRLKQKYTIVCFSELIQYTRPFYTNVEKGRSVMMLDLFLKIVDVLKLEVNFIKR